MPVSVGTTNNSSRFSNIRKHLSKEEQQTFSKLFIAHYGKTCNCGFSEICCPIGLFEKGYSEPDIIRMIRKTSKAREEIRYDD